MPLTLKNILRLVQLTKLALLNDRMKKTKNGRFYLSIIHRTFVKHEFYEKWQGGGDIYTTKMFSFIGRG